MTSAGLDIDRVLHFVFYDKVLQIYRQHYIRKFYRHILSKYQQIPENCGGAGGGGGGAEGAVTLPAQHVLASTDASNDALDKIERPQSNNDIITLNLEN